ncbi:hypothetical protein KSS87_016669 [Heliosperma pusillum]|nr:hypothetical protein KSS87_016669 [Heliosperma pusillum]
MVAKSREVLRQNGITHVLNCVGFVCPEYFKGDLVYKTLWLQDSPSEDITSILYDVFDYFEDVREQGGRVLVHCCQGVSRSTSLVIAYLMWKEGQKFEEAFEYVKAARGVTNPNMGFACQLLQCQKRVHAVPASPNSVLRMYRMAPHSPYDPLHLVPKMLGHPGEDSLDSRGAFVIHVPSTIYVWVGKLCSSVMSDNARVAAYQVIKYERAQGPILTLIEGQESSEFWNALSSEENRQEEGVNVDFGGRKVNDYNLDFDIFQKALSGGVVPPFNSPGSPDETRLPNREIGWGRLRRKFSKGIMKEFLSSPKVTENDPEDNLEEPVSPTAHLLRSFPTPLSESTIPESNEICEEFELFVRGGTDSSDYSKSPSLSPSTSGYSSPFTFSPSSSNWSDLSNLSSQPSPTGLELSDHLPKRNLDSVEIDNKLQKESSKSCLDSFDSTNGWKSSSMYSSSRGISPSIAERRGSSPPALMFRQTAEVVHVPRPLVKSWSFSLPDMNDETVKNIWGIEQEHEDITKASIDELMPDAGWVLDLVKPAEIPIVRVASKGLVKAQAVTPPRGWNSYDSFCWTVSEEEFLHNAELVSQRLRSHGYEYVVVDYLWYRRKVPGAYTDSSGFDVIDEWGRMVPDPDRWPSSKGGKGFTEVAKKVHSMGLKFGIHVMRGISTQAVNAQSPVLDTTKGGPYVEGGLAWRADDIGIKERSCTWMPHGFMSVNTQLGAGRAFLRSLYEQYAEWGVDFVKHDCVFGDDLDIEEISFVSEVLRKLSRPILYSLSPGTNVTPAMAKKVGNLVNMYRITGDDWDTWGDVASHFDVSRDFAAANMIGSSSLMGKSWPDLDMLPLGWLTDPGSNQGPHRNSKLNIEEQKTQFPYITGSHAPIIDHHNYSSSQSRHKTKGARSHTKSLTLASCKEAKAMGWSIETFDQDLYQVCWKDTEKHVAPFCLYKRKAGVTSDEELGHGTQYPGKTQLLATTKAAVCLGASPKQRLTSKEFKRGSLSTCKRDANQMWKLNTNGTLMNSYSGLCATVQALEGSTSKVDILVSTITFLMCTTNFIIFCVANAVPVGVRSWVATGRRGEVYLALFNLNQAKTTISTHFSNLSKLLPGVSSGVAYKCSEVWSRQACQISGDSISMNVEAHGAALLVLVSN